MIRRFLARLRGDTAGISVVEFALMLPVFMGVAIGGIEMASFTLANQKVQGLATLMADLVAQSGTGQIGATESQINDLFVAIDTSGQPYDIRGEGRVIVTAVQGQDVDGDNQPENINLWQRCDGDYTAAPKDISAAVGQEVTLSNGRILTIGEIMIHAQVTYKYEPSFEFNFDMFDTDREITRAAAYRPRSLNFSRITPVSGVVAKDQC